MNKSIFLVVLCVIVFAQSKKQFTVKVSASPLAGVTQASYNGSMSTYFYDKNGLLIFLFLFSYLFILKVSMTFKMLATRNSHLLMFALLTKLD